MMWPLLQLAPVAQGLPCGSSAYPLDQRHLSQRVEGGWLILQQSLSVTAGLCQKKTPRDLARGSGRATRVVRITWSHTDPKANPKPCDGLGAVLKSTPSRPCPRRDCNPPFVMV